MSIRQLVIELRPKEAAGMMVAEARSTGIGEEQLRDVVIAAIDKVELAARDKGEASFDRLRYWAELRKEVGRLCPR